MKDKKLKKLKVHFMGVGGSGMSGVAMLAKYSGFSVSGCNVSKGTNYLKILKDGDVKVEWGHNKKHIVESDIVVVSPAVLFQNRDHEEVVDAKSAGILMTWQKFLGKYLHKGKNVICVSGTHGKSTTTAMAGLLLESAQLDPSVMVGAKVKKWDANYRVGGSKIFVTEADEFYDNFLHYKPEIIILNNIEYEHTDFFKNEKQMYESFKKFVSGLKGERILIVNQDSSGIKKLFEMLGERNLSKFQIYGYTLNEKPLVEIQNSVLIKIKSLGKNSTTFSVSSETVDLNDIYHLSIPGKYNVQNAAAVVILAKLFGIDNSTIKKVVKNYKGVGRRLELIGGKRGVKVYDDYAHHPTAINVTLKALRQLYPENRIWVIIEPHSYSRTKALLNDYSGVFEDVDKVFIGPIFKARDKEKFGVNGYSIVKASGHNDIKFVPTAKQIVYKLKREVRNGDVVIVMGAGESYLWAREILKVL